MQRVVYIYGTDAEQEYGWVEPPASKGYYENISLQYSIADSATAHDPSYFYFGSPIHPEEFLNFPDASDEIQPAPDHSVNGCLFRWSAQEKETYIPDMGVVHFRDKRVYINDFDEKIMISSILNANPVGWVLWVADFVPTKGARIKVVRNIDNFASTNNYATKWVSPHDLTNVKVDVIAHSADAKGNLHVLQFDGNLPADLLTDTFTTVSGDFIDGVQISESLKNFGSELGVMPVSSTSSGIARDSFHSPKVQRGDWIGLDFGIVSGASADLDLRITITGTMVHSEKVHNATFINGNKLFNWNIDSVDGVIS